MMGYLHRNNMARRKGPVKEEARQTKITELLQVSEISNINT